MADTPRNIAASVKQRLLNMARAQGRGFDILLVRFALERLLFRLSQSAHRDNYILKGGRLESLTLQPFDSSDPTAKSGVRSPRSQSP